ncbi:MAG TPA: DUF523 domain-containing protein [Bacillota bacterium]|nr:DUF523 domain-containing protein [Bacillota bacterium]HPT66444.1 DUF523 domain-containing protein [Bacillota bacterium]
MTSSRKTLLVSACLLGTPCRFDGTHHRCAGLEGLDREYNVVQVCPETLGGLRSPRPPAELRGGDGTQVLAGRAQVITATGQDVTQAFMAGARQVLATAQTTGAVGAILKARSPSCGKGRIYDGSFTGCLVAGDGVTTALLLQNGIPVWTEDEWLERKA